jgi:hypothetical protein
MSLSIKIQNQYGRVSCRAFDDAVIISLDKSARNGGMAISRFLIGGVASALLLTGGVFIWKGYSQVAEDGVLPDPPPALPAIPVAAANAPKHGPAPLALPAAKEASREERRFNRFDRDRNDKISRIELMSSRTAAFRKLDADGNNLLTFEEWAAATGQRFAGADGDKSGDLTRAEFATTAPKLALKGKCSC